jgi:ribosomal-protein-alanine N-acetyltransferase
LGLLGFLLIVTDTELCYNTVMGIYVKLAEFARFETERLILRPFVLSDAADMFEYASNPKNLEFIFLPHSSLGASRFFIANNFMKNPLGKWAIELKNEKKMIGTLHYVKLSEKKLAAEIGYVLNQSYWNQGLLTEALSALTKISFEEFGLKRLELLIDEENIASKKVAIKAGYKDVQHFKAAHQYTGLIRKFEKYQLEKNEFYQR